MIIRVTEASITLSDALTLFIYGCRKRKRLRKRKKKRKKKKKKGKSRSDVEIFCERNWLK